MVVFKKIDEEDDDGDDWEGTIRKLTRIMERQSKTIQETVVSKTDKLQTTIEDFSRKDTIQDRALKAYIDSSVRVQSEKVRSDVISHVNQVDRKLDQVLAAIQLRNDEQ